MRTSIFIFLRVQYKGCLNLLKFGFNLNHCSCQMLSEICWKIWSQVLLLIVTECTIDIFLFRFCVGNYKKLFNFPEVLSQEGSKLKVFNPAQDSQAGLALVGCPQVFHLLSAPDSQAGLARVGCPQVFHSLCS